MSHWPLQSQCDAFYGNPRGIGGSIESTVWHASNIKQIIPPFSMHMAGPITKISVHKKCATSFDQWLNEVWINAGRDQEKIKFWGMDIFSGSLVFRTMRTNHLKLSMHSYGCAIDFDAPHNGQGSRNGKLSRFIKQVINPFKDLGGTWGGDWKNGTDDMHFQFANVG